MDINDITPDLINENKIETVYVIGHIDSGNSGLAALRAIEAASEKHNINFIVVESMSELKERVGAELIVHEKTENGKNVILIDGRKNGFDKPKNLAFEPEPFIIEKLPELEPIVYATEVDLRKQNKKKKWQSPYKFHR